MLRQIAIAAAVVTALLFSGAPAHAIGVYADVPLQFTFTECAPGADCTFSPSGLKAGVVLPSNIGIGAQSYTIHDQGTTVDYLLLDVSYLLPIPVVNVMLGAGGGNVGLKFGGTDKSGRATNVWVSAGFPILPLFDIHVAYHSVQAAIHDSGGIGDVNLNGRMYSIGALFNF